MVMVGESVNGDGSNRTAALGLAAAASIGAGAIHCIAAGVHAEHVTLSRLFILAGVAQILVGAWALRGSRRASSMAIVAVNAIAVGAWAVSRTTGVSWIPGLEQRESAGLADSLCALLGSIAVVAGLWSLRSVTARRPVPLAVPALAVAALLVPAAWSITDHQHDHGDHAAAAADHHDAGAADPAHAADPAQVGQATTGHSHSATTLPGVSAEAAAHTETTAATATHEHQAASVAPVAYDPTKPIDLGGVPGVTPEQQAAAENIVAETLIRLPQWADYHTAEAAGFHSIGDALTGVEHYVNWAWIDDDVILNPNFPESLVYEPQPDGSKKLASAMYMLSPKVALADVPDIGGPLMQWHIHDNLCFNNDADGPKVRGLTDAQGNCPPNLQKFPPAAMIHVWIVPHKCGPFAALEGIGAGQVVEGQDHACDAAHGSH